jgi:hypothetical protein
MEQFMGIIGIIGVSLAILYYLVRERSGTVPDGISALGSLVLLECTIYHE